MLGMLRSVIAQPVMRGIAVAGLACSLVQAGLLSFLVTYLNLGLGLSLVTAGLVLTASQLAAVVGRMAWGWVSDRLGDPLRVLAVISLLSGLDCIALGLMRGTWPVALHMLVAAGFGATAVSWNGVFLGGIARHAPPGQVAQVTSGVMVGVYLGALLGPLLYSVLLAASGRYETGFLLFSVIAFAAAVVIHSIRGKARRAAGASA